MQVSVPMQSVVASQAPPPLPEKKTSNQGELIAKMHLVEKHIRKNKLQVTSVPLSLTGATSLLFVAHLSYSMSEAQTPSSPFVCVCVTLCTNKRNTNSWCIHQNFPVRQQHS